MLKKTQTTHKKTPQQNKKNPTQTPNQFKEIDANKGGSSDIRMRTEMKPQCIEGVVYLKNNLDMISKIYIFSTSIDYIGCSALKPR